MEVAFLVDHAGADLLDLVSCQRLRAQRQRAAAGGGRGQHGLGHARLVVAQAVGAAAGLVVVDHVGQRHPLGGRCASDAGSVQQVLDLGSGAVFCPLYCRNRAISRAPLEGQVARAGASSDWLRKVN